MRPVTSCRRIAFCLAILLLTCIATAHAQPGTILSFSKINSVSLGALGITLADGDEFGDSAANLGDLDGPGPSVAALAVGSIGDDDGGSHFGAVYILFLNSTGSVISYQKISATHGNFTGVLESNDEFGSSVAWLGDIDGAGPSAGALAVGAIGDDDGGIDHGAVYVLLLNSSGSVISTQKVNSVQVGVPADISANGEEFGGAVCGLGDLDGAGPAAVAMAVGAIGDDDGGYNRGAAFIVYLDSSGGFLSSAKISDTAGNFTAVLENSDGLAEDVADLGDFDGAGPAVRTVAVTSVEDNDGSTASGAVYLIHLNANGTTQSWSKISRTAGGWTSPVISYDNFGTAVTALGDLDGTGPSYRAIAVSASGDDGAGFERGAVYILYLNSAGSVLSYQEISSVSGGAISGQMDDTDEFGSALTVLGDIDGSGGAAQVLVAGVSFDDDGGPDRGAAYLLNLAGGATGPGAPVVTAPATASVAENAPLTVNVTASDPDGDAITSLTASGLPAGASFTPNGSNTSGTLNWTPTYSQSGTYTVTFIASNSLSGSSSTTITVTNVNRPPVVTAPANAAGPENAPLTVNVTASDPDGQSITTLTATGLPSGATFTPNGSNTSGTLSWTPGYSQSGTYNVTFTATNALSGSASTTITITNVDRAPTVSAPANAAGPENAPLTVNVTASDPDGQSITTLTATGLPSGATFTPGGGNTSGTLNWTPTYSQSGSYNVTFTATNALSGSSSTSITITNVDRAPVVTAPANAGGPENAPLTVNVTASDPDGQTITTLTATGMPAGATFTPNGSKTSGTLSWTPTYSQSGIHNVTFTATNALSGSSSTTITISNVDRAPTVTAPPAASASEGVLLTVNVTASDPDGEAITSLTMSAVGAPAGAIFTPGPGNTTGTLLWTPGFNDAGNFTVTFTASNALSGSSTTGIIVSDVDQAPVVAAPAAALASEGVLLSLQVTAVDPDGNAIASLTATGLPVGATFTPDPGNASGTLEWTPGFSQAGIDTVVFTATNALAGSSTTRITVSDVDRAPVVTAPASAPGWEGLPLTIHVTAADPDGQPITSLTATDLPEGATFTPGPDNTTGTLEWTPAAGQAGDRAVTFTAANALPGSSSTQLTITVPSAGVGPPELALLRPLLVPSPLRSRSTLSFRTTEPGPIEVDLLDLSGRRVRQLMSVSGASAGVHQIQIDGRSDRGDRLPSGIYLYRIRAARRAWTGRLVITR